jgi:hypothetical protein
MPIVISREGRPARRLERKVIQDEAYLQRYIFEHPDVLPLEQLDESIRPLVLVREFPTPSGPIDAVAVDQNGNLYLIETKLYKNPDKRLVIAQVLDYGAALWKAYADPDGFIERLDAILAARSSMPLAERVRSFYGFDEAALGEFRESLKSTIASGRFRFVVLMDTIEERLKHLIAYVNASSSFDLLGVALDFYEDGDVHILIPTLHGAEAKKQTSTTVPGRHTWDAQSFMSQAASRLSPDELNVVRRVHDWSLRIARRVDYGTGQIGSFSPKFPVYRRSPFTVNADGRLALNFGWLTEPEEAKAFAQRFGRALIERGFELPADFAERWLYLPAEKWMKHSDDLMTALAQSLDSASAESV